MPTIPIVWKDNTEALRASLIAGMNTIEATRASVDKLVQSFSGERLAASAQKWVLAINQVGGATKLTASEQERAAAVLDKYIEKQNALGRAVPAAVSALSSEVKAIIATRDAAESAATPTQALAGWFGTLGTTIVGTAAGFFTAQAAFSATKAGIAALTDEVQTLVMHGAAVSDVTGNFQRLTTQAGLLGSQLLGQLRAGTHATIDDFALMKTVNQDLAAGMRLTDQQFGALGKGAFALAQATGTDVKTALDTMNDAMLTGRTRALALLTGKIDLEAAEKKFAASLGTTTEHLSEEGKLEAARAGILDAVAQATDRLGEQVDGLDEHVAQAQVSWANFHDELAKTVAESPVLEAGFAAIKDAIAGAVGADQQALVTAVAAKIDDASMALVGLAQAGVTAGGFLATEFLAAKKVFGDLAQVVDGDALAFKGAALAAAELFSLGGHAGPLKDDVVRIKGEIDGLIDRMAARGKALQDDDAAQQRVDASTKALRDTLADLQRKMQAAKETSAAFVGPLQDAAAAQGAVGAAAEKSAGLIQQSKEEIAKARAETEKWNTANADLAALIDGMNWDGTIEGALRLGVSVSTVATWFGVATGEVQRAKQGIEEWAKASEAATDQAQDAWKKWAEEQKKLDDEIEHRFLQNNAVMVSAMRDTADAIAKDSLNAFDYQRRQVLEWQDQMEGAIDYTQENWKDAYEAIAKQAEEKLAEIQHAADMEDVKIKFTFVGPEKPAYNAIIAQFGERLSHDIGEAVKNVPATIERAFEGGGDWAGAAASLGAQFGSILGKNIGASIAALGSMGGPIGSAIGALAGPLISLIAGIGGPSKQELAGRGAVGDFEGQFKNTADMIGQVQAAYLATGHTAAEANAAITAMWNAEKQGAEATKAAIDKVNAVLAQQKALAANAQTATSGIGGFLGVNTGAMDTQAKDQTQLADLNGQLSKAAPGSDQYNTIKAQIDKLNQDILNQQQIIDATAITTQNDATAMGAAVVGAFDAAIQGGASFAEALRQNQPAIEALRAEIDKAGLDGGAAFNLLARQIDLIKDPIAGPVLTAVQNLAAGFKGLAATGSETQQEFQGFGDSVKQAFDKLVAQGKSAPEIMVAMQGPLQELWEEEQQYGFTLDDATQALLDQAEAAGEVGEKHKSTSQQMLDAENKLVDIMTLLAHRFGVDLPNAVESGVKDAKGDLGDLKGTINDLPTSKTFTFDIQTNGDIPQLPSGDTSGGLATGGLVGLGRLIPFPVAAMASGGIVPQHADYERAAGFAGGRLIHFPDHIGTDTVPAMLTPRELVINEVQTGHVGQTLESALTAAQAIFDIAKGTQGDGAAPSDVRPIIKVQLVVGRKVFAETMVDVYRTDEAGIRGVTKKVAGGTR